MSKLASKAYALGCSDEELACNIDVAKKRMTNFPSLPKDTNNSNTVLEIDFQPQVESHGRLGLSGTR
jgi:hypothetical protein